MDLDHGKGRTLFSRWFPAWGVAAVACTFQFQKDGLRQIEPGRMRQAHALLFSGKGKNLGVAAMPFIYGKNRRGRIVVARGQSVTMGQLKSENERYWA
jgi:hypothetical protein